MTATPPPVLVRNTRPADVPGIVKLCRVVYPDSPPWRDEQLVCHLGRFPEGQFVAVESDSQRVVGMAASLIIKWDDYGRRAAWRDVTDNGFFTNHDPRRGRTLYGAEVMVDPTMQRRGIGAKLYRARRELVERLGLRRIRAAARLRWYHRYADRMSAADYVQKVVRGELKDPTLSFQLKQGFDVIGVVGGYLLHDPKSLGYAAIIEWLNPQVATPAEMARRDSRFAPVTNPNRKSDVRKERR
jgi:GNAT superfamily N-acetyltransferase